IMFQSPADRIGPREAQLPRGIGQPFGHVVDAELLGQGEQLVDRLCRSANLVKREAEMVLAAEVMLPRVLNLLGQVDEFVLVGVHGPLVASTRKLRKTARTKQRYTAFDR